MDAKNQREKTAKAFNEWMRRFEEEPARFESEYAGVKRYLQERAGGIEPTYGERCAAYLEQLMAEA